MLPNGLSACPQSIKALAAPGEVPCTTSCCFCAFVGSIRGRGRRNSLTLTLPTKAQHQSAWKSLAQRWVWPLEPAVRCASGAGCRIGLRVFSARLHLMLCLSSRD